MTARLVFLPLMKQDRHVSDAHLAVNEAGDDLKESDRVLDPDHAFGGVKKSVLIV